MPHGISDSIRDSLRDATDTGHGLVNGVLSSMWTGLSLRFSRVARRELAEKAEISVAYLSRIEGGVREGAVLTMKASAMARNLDLTDLV